MIVRTDFSSCICSATNHCTIFTGVKSFSMLHNATISFIDAVMNCSYLIVWWLTEILRKRNNNINTGFGFMVCGSWFGHCSMVISQTNH